MLVSRRKGSAVYRVDAGGLARVVLEGVEAPAGIGWDATRGRVLTLRPTQNRLRTQTLGRER